MRYIIDRNLSSKNDAGFKARIDVIKISRKFLFEYKEAYSSEGNIMKRFINRIKCLFDISNFENGSIVLIQYPLKISYLNFVARILKYNKNISILLIHDIECMRFNEKKRIKNKEIKLYNKFDYIIAHNENMKLWMKKNGVKTEILILDIFDYLSHKSNSYSKKSSNNNNFSISYATGKLGSKKSEFLYKLNQENINYKVLLYGNIEEHLYNNLNDTMIYKGSLSPEKIIDEIEGEFGLIWDGSSLKDCDGILGEYTRINSPHKLSMYMAAEIPVIVWEGAACSNFVKENNVGIVVKNFEQIHDKIYKLTLEEYNEIKVNVKEIGKKVRNGNQLAELLKNIIEIK